MSDKLPLCSECEDAARHSLANELREGLKVRGLYAPQNTSDLIGAIFSAIDALLPSSNG